MAGLVVGLIITGIVVVGFIAFAVWRVVAAHLAKASTGREELIGAVAVARGPLKPEGFVLFKGEFWAAVSESGPVNPGEEVVITRVEGLRLHVRKK